MDKEIAKIDLVSNNACDTIIYYKIVYKRTPFVGSGVATIRKTDGYGSSPSGYLEKGHPHLTYCSHVVKGSEPHAHASLH